MQNNLQTMAKKILPEDKENWKEITLNYPIWQAEQVGDFIEGRLLAKRNGKYGDTYDIDTKEGIFTLPNLTVLNSKIGLIDMHSIVRIVYMGEEKSISGRTYKDLKVFVKDEKQSRI